MKTKKTTTRLLIICVINMKFVRCIHTHIVSEKIQRDENAIYESLICGEWTVTKNILRMDTFLEVILQKQFFLGILIFWIVLRCGVNDFGRWGV